MTPSLDDFSDFVELGRVLCAARDGNAWALGDLACAFEVQLWNRDDPDSPNLSDLAREWDAALPRVSEWRNNARFYPPEFRTYELSWSHYLLARRHSDGQLDNALELLHKAVDLHLNYNAFSRYVKGEYYEGPQPVASLPPAIQAMIPAGVGRVWAVYRVCREVENQ